MTSSETASAVFKDTEHLTFDDYVRDMMLQFGATPEAVAKMWQVPTNDRLHTPGLQPNPRSKSFVHLSEVLYRQQLHPGEKLNNLQHVLLSHIDKTLSWETDLKKVVISSTPIEKTVSLLEWTRQVLLDGATRAFFGSKLREIEPGLFETFFYFDDNSWKLTYKIPRYWSNDVYAAKQKAQDALRIYFELPKEQRCGEAWIIRTLETELRGLGVNEPDIAAIMMMIFWVINGNAYKLCFWILTYVLHDQSLHTMIRDEIGPIVDAAASAGDLPVLLNDCPHLNAVYHEVLRLTSSSSSIRNVLKPTCVSGKNLRIGTKVLIPFRQLHFNEDIFGADAATFNPERFLRNKEIHRSGTFRPFGGGTTHCPGRFLAKNEVLVFTALVLTRFDITLAEKGSDHASAFPKIEDGKPCLGIMGPVNGADVLLRVRKRK